MISEYNVRKGNLSLGGVEGRPNKSYEYMNIFKIIYLRMYMHVYMYSLYGVDISYNLKAEATISLPQKSDINLIIITISFYS